ncbi:MAG: hypothetical protein KGN36_02355 [Acidobacteriota bacterium]|nr:hypothetical protein [Acidobacteriota bacterium]
MAIYDLSGKLSDIVGGAGLGHPYLELQAADQTYTIKAAPYQFLVSLGIPALIGQNVTVTVAQCRQGSLLALKIAYDGAVYVLRDTSGTPVWGKQSADLASVNAAGGSVVDAATITTLTVVVEKIGVSLLSNQVRVLVRTQEQRLAWVSLGPAELLLGQGLELEAGDQVRIMLASRTATREWLALQLSNPETGQMAQLRDMSGNQYALK